MTHYKKARYHNRRKRYGNKGAIIRVILGITASLLIPFFPMMAARPNDISILVPLMFGFVAAPIGILGTIVSLWKRRAGAGLMLLAFIPALLIALGNGGWSWFPPLILGFCIFSLYWHILPD